MTIDSSRIDLYTKFNLSRLSNFHWGYFSSINKSQFAKFNLLEEPVALNLMDPLFEKAVNHVGKTKRAISLSEIHLFIIEEVGTNTKDRAKNIHYQLVAARILSFPLGHEILVTSEIELNKIVENIRTATKHFKQPDKDYDNKQLTQLLLKIDSFIDEFVAREIKTPFFSNNQEILNVTPYVIALLTNDLCEVLIRINKLNSKQTNLFGYQVISSILEQFGLGNKDTLSITTESSKFLNHAIELFINNARNIVTNFSLIGDDTIELMDRSKFLLATVLKYDKSELIDLYTEIIDDHISLLTCGDKKHENFNLIRPYPPDELRV